MVKAQPSKEVHLIPDEDDPGMRIHGDNSNDQPNARNGIEWSCNTADMDAFSEAFRVSNAIGASAITREALQLNKILLHIHQKKSARHCSEYHGNRSNKRRQPDESKDSERQDDASLTQEESEAVWKRVKRVRRMAIYLKNAQFSQQLLLREMAELTASEPPKRSHGNKP
jgi:hypothetical protein